MEGIGIGTAFGGTVSILMVSRQKSFPRKAVFKSTTDSAAAVLLPEFQVAEKSCQVPGSFAKISPIDTLLIEKFRVGWYARVGTCPIPIGRIRNGSGFLFSVVVHLLGKDGFYFLG